MTTAQVTSYTAHVGLLGLLGSERVLIIRHAIPGGTGSEDATSEVYFSDRFAAGGGFSTVDHGTSARSHLPLEDFPIWLDLLRHEKPVFLNWVCEMQGTPDVEGMIHLSTGPEPPGEGPIDQSPDLGR